MYTDDDLNQAIEQNIFSQQAVDQFRAQFARQHNTTPADEENFRLINSFNDIFIVITCLLLLGSVLWLLLDSGRIISSAAIALLSWGLAEVFVRRKKMALPAIVLLLTFIGAIFFTGMGIFGDRLAEDLIITSLVTALAAFAHWQRFSVPITVAAGFSALLALIYFVLVSVISFSSAAGNQLIISFGVLTFLFAMYWDSADRQRLSYKSDVAFWLHLLAAPLIIHPVFSQLGIVEGHAGVNTMLLVLALYSVMTMVSVAIDRRAFMVSSLVYVLYALSQLLSGYLLQPATNPTDTIELASRLNDSFAITGIIVGSALLLLSAFWQSTRALLLTLLPETVKAYLPPTKAG